MSKEIYVSILFYSNMSQPKIGGKIAEKKSFYLSKASKEDCNFLFPLRSPTNSLAKEKYLNNNKTTNFDDVHE